jgi:hypothetical protein
MSISKFPVHNSLLSVYAQIITGGAGLSGPSYHCKDSIINTGITLPGGHQPHSENVDCKVRGPAFDNPSFDNRLASLSAQLKTMRRETGESLDRSEQAIRRTDEELNTMRRETGEALGRSEQAIRRTDEQLRRIENHFEAQRRRDLRIAIPTIIVLAVAIGLACFLSAAKRRSTFSQQRGSQREA